ncbi:MAG: hypothetical protein ACO3DQ_07640 [Cephaloticoccus sp.]
MTSLTTFADPLPATNFPKLVDGIHRAMADQLFSPNALGADAGADFFTRLDSLARTATDDEAFTAGFKEAATLLPFSHVELRRSATPLPEQLTYLDQMRTGPKSVQLRAEDGIAVLRVRTMMGVDTIEAITAAYGELAANPPRALIIDLRGNTGGAFAVIPLVEHLIEQPVDAGWFFGRRWWEAHDSSPTARDALEIAPWRGYSLLSFWHDVTREPLLRANPTHRSNPTPPVAEFGWRGAGS